jgi:hypothetical protein
MSVSGEFMDPPPTQPLFIPPITLQSICLNSLDTILPKQMIIIIIEYAKTQRMQFEPTYIEKTLAVSEYVASTIMNVKQYMCQSLKPLTFGGSGSFTIRLRVFGGDAYLGFLTQDTRSRFEIQPNGFYQFRNRYGGRVRCIESFTNPTSWNQKELEICYNTSSTEIEFYIEHVCIKTIQYSLEPLSKRYFYVLLFSHIRVELLE